jgi:Na+-translocating ferredoxin:NAD+ oxidoreductase subunit B
VIKLHKREHMERQLMDDSIYKKLALVLDTLPNGFPLTESGVEIKLLKKIFTPKQAEMFCELRLAMETADEIAARTGRDPVQTRGILETMREDGQVFSVKFGDIRWYKMIPWVFGIYEFQLHRLDKELAELADEFSKYFGKGFFSEKPQLMQVLPIEAEITPVQTAMPWERVSSIIEQGQSFRIMDCICKIKNSLLGHQCSRTARVCMAIAPVPDVFEDDEKGRIITREEAYAILRKSEEEALVHLTGNTQFGQFYICNCCSCCCGVLKAIDKFGIPASSVVNSQYFAEIDGDACTGCGICSDERCQVKAIDSDGDFSRVIRERCIGCGLCISTCPVSAIKLIRKPEDQISIPPVTENDWFEERGKNRGVDFSGYK